MDQNDSDVNERENIQIEKTTWVKARTLHEAIRRSGEEELSRPSAALWWSGLAAGLSMGFSMLAEGLLRAHLPDYPWRPLLAKLGYPFGFLIVILGKQQLFTENTLTAVLPLLTNRDRETLGRMLRLWIVVLVANLVGAHIFAWVVGNTSVFAPEIQHAFREIADEAMNVTFGAAILRGIFAGWLIALAVWVIPGLASGRVAMIAIITYFVGLGHLTHIIAGSVETLFLVMTGVQTWWHWSAAYMLPTLIGNTIGGVSLVSALNHAQVVSGGRSTRGLRRLLMP